jgi:hypothetical protein
MVTRLHIEILKDLLDLNSDSTSDRYACLESLEADAIESIIKHFSVTDGFRARYATL